MAEIGNPGEALTPASPASSGILGERLPDMPAGPIAAAVPAGDSPVVLARRMGSAGPGPTAEGRDFQGDPGQGPGRAEARGRNAASGNSGGGGTLTLEEFRVELGKLHDAIVSVRNESYHIGDVMARIPGRFTKVEAAWNSPASTTIDDVKTWFTVVSGHQHDLLEEMVRRMQSVYDNFRAAEEANTRNVT
ncbi:hypothetical protein [Streptomyces shenzhenensis]|uniref:hypothetical protein n=1 Tax=Streptomyces shenzhenensis TaxID=943815 RepID=UPI0036B80E94